MEKSSSSLSVGSSKSDCDSSQLKDVQISEKWFHQKLKLPKDLVICSVCYCYVHQPIQCQKCDRLFCKEDYHIIKESLNSCPLCKTSPWLKKQSIHISYKAIISQLRFKCQLCQIKNIHEDKLQQHLRTHHKLKYRKYEDKIYDYTLKFNDGREETLNFYQNLQVNYYRKIMKDSTSEMTILHQQENFIKLNFTGMSFLTDIKNKGAITTKVSEIIVPNTDYTVWAFDSHHSDKQFYLQNHQKEIEKQYEEFQKNDKLNQTHIDAEDNSGDRVRYRLMFSTMKQVNVKTGFKRGLMRETFKFQLK